MRVLVTGGAGFIGSHVVDRLKHRGDEVVVLDDLSSGSLRNIQEHLRNPRFSFVRGDVRRVEDVEVAVRGVEAVVHQAAIASVPLSIQNPKLTEDVNVGGTLNLLEACVRAGVERFVLASSAAVYGIPSKLPIKEDSPLNPLSPYARTKLAAEEHCLRYHRGRGLVTVRLRYFNVYGPRQTAGDYAGVMVKFLQRIRGGEPPIIFGDGLQTRDFIHVEDAVEATLLALDSEGIGGEAFNVGTGRAITVNRLCEMFLEVMGREDLGPIHEDARPGDIRHSQADITKAKKLLGFEPRIPIEEGIKTLIGT